ncbi:Reticulocyte-binding protein 2 a [Amphibalanus amphitrite]|uniref:Reticulocyte-binding protein 2 a n=1 Tax=Amphibalanus amphitrite TaxID=1232801 RepID=A0A6A4VAX4_AMPAM|nr:Reticulocyte-binding protein 2 a [Amphibalanus amphitrite]
MREHVTLLLMASSENLWDVDLLLEPLTDRQEERQLRLRLGRTLVRQAILEGVCFRHTAPWWESWWKENIPPLARTAPLLLQWWHYTESRTYRQQCYLFMAWLVVDSADMQGGRPMTSQVSDIVTLDVAPLIQLLTRTDLEYLLGDPDKVETWCSQQLRRPLEERPAGLTAELDTPRGRAELLLRPELLLQAVRVNVTGKMVWWRDIDQAMENMWMKNYRPIYTYQKIREKLERHINTNLHESLCVKLPEMDAASVDATAGLWRRRLQQLLSGDRLRTMYNAITGWWPDRWEMTSHYLAVHEADSEDSEQDDDDGQAGGEERRDADEDQTSGGLPSPQREKWQQLERQHQQLWQQLDRRGHGERRSLNQQHDEERRRLERIHDRKWRSMEMRHHGERKRLHQRHESVNRCVELQYQGQAQQERRQRHLVLLDRRNRRQLAVLEWKHQLEWGDLEQKVQTQWNKLKQKHLRESQELEERYPNMRSGEELDQLMEECSRRRRQLREELEKELGKEKEKEKKKEKESRKVQKKMLKVKKEEEKPAEREATRRHRQQLIQLQERHNQELEEQRRRHRQEREDLERRLSRRRHGQERRHPQ